MGMGVEFRGFPSISDFFFMRFFKIHQGGERDYVSTDTGTYGGQGTCDVPACVSTLSAVDRCHSQSCVVAVWRASGVRGDSMPARLQVCWE
jgi:hypothetical protein